MSSMVIEQHLDEVEYERLRDILLGGYAVDVGPTHQMAIAGRQHLPYHRGPGTAPRSGPRATWAAKRRIVTALNRRRRRRGLPTHYSQPYAVLLPRVQFLGADRWAVR